jgi:hypothetical protein
VLAARDGVDPAGLERARRRLRALLAQDPRDRDALDLLVAVATGPREAAEVVGALRAAAERSVGDERGRLMAAPDDPNANVAYKATPSVFKSNFFGALTHR